MTISLRLSNEDTMLFKKYAEMNGISVSELVRQSVLERIEDEYDIVVAEEAYKEYVDSGCKSTPVADFWRELDAEEV